MTSSCEIVSLSGADNNECFNLYTQVFDEALPKVAPDLIRDAVTREGAIGFVALDSSGISQGAAVLSLNTDPYRGTSEARLEYLGVIKTERNNRLGTRLMAAVESACSAAGKQTLSLQSSSAKAALRLYTRRGFSMYDPMKREMVKRLGSR